MTENPKDEFQIEFHESAMRPVNFHDDGTPISGLECVELIKQESPDPDTTLLAFSGGKDSLCAWLFLRQHFKNIVPFYMYRVPNLPYVNKMLKGFEQYFGQRIYRLPNPDLYHYLRALMWQAPENCAVIEAADLPDPSYDLLMALLREWLNIPDGTFCATGVRAVDNIERGMSVRQHGPINWRRRTWWPVWDMKKDDVIDMLDREGCPLSIEYFWFGHSLGGMDYRYLKGLKDNSPEDWKLVLEWFPLAELEIARYDQIGKHWRKDNTRG